MLDRVEEILDGSRLGAYSGEVVNEFGEKKAEKILQSGLEELELMASDLRVLKKTDSRKQVLAWMVRRTTSVRSKWIAEKLEMGHEVNVSQSVRRVEEAKNGDPEKLQNLDDDNTNI